MEVVVGLPVDEVDLAEQFLLVVLEFPHHFVFCSVNFFEIITYFCLKINFVHVHVVLEVAFVIVWKMNHFEESRCKIAEYRPISESKAFDISLRPISDQNFCSSWSADLTK